MWIYFHTHLKMSGFLLLVLPALTIDCVYPLTRTQEMKVEKDQFSCWLSPVQVLSLTPSRWRKWTIPVDKLIKKTQIRCIIRCWLLLICTVPTSLLYVQILIFQTYLDVTGHFKLKINSCSTMCWERVGGTWRPTSVLCRICFHICNMAASVNRAGFNFQQWKGRGGHLVLQNKTVCGQNRCQNKSFLLNIPFFSLFVTVNNKN